MSRIDELIQQMCPDGVEFRPLSVVADYGRGRVSASMVDEHNYVGVDNLLQNCGGKTTSSFVPSSGALVAFERDDLLVGNIRPYLKKIWLADCKGGTNGDVLVIRIRPDMRPLLSPEFVYYLLSSDRFFAYDTQNAKGAKMPRGDKAAIMRFPMPIPPIEVQRAIVAILDEFTNLKAELEAELEARRKQYAHYRDQLLTFTEARGGGLSG